MADVAIKFKMLENFFDRETIVRSMDRATHRSLSRAGSYVRRTARTRLRKRKGSASPGQSPHGHEGGLRDGVVFAYDAYRKSVVIGPLAYNADHGAVPGLLERGGHITRLVEERIHGGRARFVKVRSRNRHHPNARNRTFKYRAFPYMGPALKENIPNFPGLWAGVLSK